MILNCFSRWRVTYDILIRKIHAEKIATNRSQLLRSQINNWSVADQRGDAYLLRATRNVSAQPDNCMSTTHRIILHCFKTSAKSNWRLILREIPEQGRCHFRLTSIDSRGNNWANRHAKTIRSFLVCDRFSFLQSATRPILAKNPQGNSMVWGKDGSWTKEKVSGLNWISIYWEWSDVRFSLGQTHPRKTQSD